MKSTCLSLLVVAVFATITTSTGCSGTQHPTDGGSSTPTNWISTAETSLNVLASALPVARGVVQGLPIDPAVKASIIASIVAAENQLPAVRTAIDTYRTNPTEANLCLARSAIALLASLSLNVSEALGAAGFATPSLILVAVGGIASLVDEFIPVCAVDAGMTMSASIQSRLHALPLGLHPLPGEAR